MVCLSPAQNSTFWNRGSIVASGFFCAAVISGIAATIIYSLNGPATLCFACAVIGTALCIASLISFAIILCCKRKESEENAWHKSTNDFIERKKKGTATQNSTEQPPRLIWNKYKKEKQQVTPHTQSGNKLNAIPLANVNLPNSEEDDHKVDVRLNLGEIEKSIDSNNVGDSVFMSDLNLKDIKEDNEKITLLEEWD